MNSFLLDCLAFAVILKCTLGFQSSYPLSSRHVSQYDSISRLSSITTSEDTQSSSSSPSSNEEKVDFQAYGNGYKTVFKEIPAAECTASSGSIPSDLKGSYFRCGPAMFSAGSIAPPKTSMYVLSQIFYLKECHKFFSFSRFINSVKFKLILRSKLSQL
jgi:hypothetical protein